MRYLMEDVSLLFNNEHKKVSLLVQENEIRYIGYSIPRFNVMKVNVQAFYLTPSSVMYSPDIPSFPFDIFKAYFSKEFLLKGCGCLVTDFTIQYEYQFTEKLKKKRLQLLNSPIDYILGVKLEANKLTPSVIRMCKREKIPVLFVQLNNSRELEKIPWGWLREASYPNKPVFVPDVSKVDKTVIQKHILRKWHEITGKEKISHLSQPLPQHSPLNLNTIKKIGLYPKKGVLKQGGEINYNLVLKQEYFSALEKNSQMPHISINNGKLVNVNQNPIFLPGFGSEIKINQTGLFN